MKLKKEELLKIEGGGFTFGLLITAGVIFLIGVFDGFMRPLPCN